MSLNSGNRNMTRTTYDMSIAGQLRNICKPDAADIPQTYPPGRRCKSTWCITVLNRFNPGPLCLMHAARVRGQVENPAIETIEELGELMAA